MNDLMNCFFSYSGAGFATSLLVFTVTVFLVGRGVLNFSMTLLFLVFSLVAGFIVSNQDVFRDYMTGKEKKTTEQAKESQDGLKAQFSSAIDALKKEVDALKQSSKDKDSKDKP